MSNYEFNVCKAKHTASLEKMREDHREMKSWADWLYSKIKEHEVLKSKKYTLEGELKYIGKSSDLKNFTYRKKKAELDLVLAKIDELLSDIETCTTIAKVKEEEFEKSNSFFKECGRDFEYQKNIKDSQEKIYEADKLERKAQQMREDAKSKASSARYTEEARREEQERRAEAARQAEYERNKGKREKEKKLQELKERADRARKDADDCSIM